MKKINCLIIALILLAISIFLITTNYEFLKNLYHFSEWGAYLFPVPTIYFFYAYFSKSGSKSKTIIISITIGAMISILLTRNFAESFWIQKIIATLLGAITALILAENL